MHRQMKRIKFYIPYLLLRLSCFSISFLPHSWICYFGRKCGPLAFFCAPKFRKRALSNIALASDLNLHNDQIRSLAKKSFENLLITLLEFAKLSRRTRLKHFVETLNTDEAAKILRRKQGVIFFCGHQANWELLFLDGIRRFNDGTAIARPIKNPLLYDWIKSVREQFGGKIIDQRQALKEGIKALRQGKFLGIVGDQGMPESPFSSKFLGRRAWTSPAPALLSYKTGCPIIVATILRKKIGYQIHYSKPIYPDLKQPRSTETTRLMHHCLAILENSIKHCPEQWLWHHNRWKQETPHAVYYRFRHDSILIIFPEEKSKFQSALALGKILRQIYPKAFISVFVPVKYQHAVAHESWEVMLYTRPSELYLSDFRFKLIFNFTDHRRIAKVFLRQSAFEVLNFADITSIARKHKHLEEGEIYTSIEILKRALCRPGTFWDFTEKSLEKRNSNPANQSEGYA